MVWSAYEAAYEARYQRLPKRNGWVHNDLQKLIKNVGADDAARIAGYHPTTNHQFYVKNWHAFRFMVTDYEKAARRDRNRARCDGDHGPSE